MQRKASNPPRDLYIELDDAPEEATQKLLTILSEATEQAQKLVYVVDTIKFDLTSGSVDDLIDLLSSAFTEKRIDTIRTVLSRLSLLVPRISDGGKYARLKRKQKTSGVVKYRGKLYQQVKE